MELREFVAAGKGFGDLYEDIAEAMDLHRFFNPAGNTAFYYLAGLIEAGDVQYYEIRTLFNYLHRRGLVGIESRANLDQIRFRPELSSLDVLAGYYQRKSQGEGS